MSFDLYKDWERFAALFQGLEGAFGYNSSPPRWVKRPLRPEDWVKHLSGTSCGIGIAPLRPDNTVMFAAIDLDEPDFKAARQMQEFIPGVSWLERSKSGNAHVWVFFREPLEAWVAMGILREAVTAGGKEHVEVFPKNHDFARVRLGNYINLPFHGDSRPIISSSIDADAEQPTLEQFVDEAHSLRSDPEDWRKRANWLLIQPPDKRERTATFGERRNLHICAEHVIATADENPVAAGHRAAVFFMLAKCLTNWSEVDHDEALDLMRSVNDAALDKTPESELERMLTNAERGQYTSTGCDDPLVAPYRHPDCKIGA